MPEESSYHRAESLLADAIEYLPVGGALQEEGNNPMGYAQVVAIAGLGTAILALAEELHTGREAGT